MTLNQLVGECCARENCTIDDKDCPFSKECSLFEDIFVCPPIRMKEISEREKEKIVESISENLERWVRKK